MLVLSRKVGQQIVIDGEIVVTVVEVWRGKVRIGISAPKQVVVMRRELLTPPPSPPSNGPGPSPH